MPGLFRFTDIRRALLSLSPMQTIPKKRAIVSVTNDLVTDNRVRRLCGMLTELGYDVCFVGRRLPQSPPLPHEPYRMHRMRLLFNRNAVFYAEYNLRLFFFLLFRKADVLVANDLDTLLANYLAARLKGAELVYDSHELFTEVPELDHNRFAKKVWLRLEKWLVPNLRHAVTVNRSIADILEKRYGVPFLVLRNMPYRYRPTETKTRAELGLPEDKKIIILQGNGINVRRGAEEAVEAMQYVSVPAVLLIVGNGDVIPALKRLAEENGLTGKVIFKPRMPYAELMQYTRLADLGITLDKPDNLNYLYSLPNKIFDYIQAEIPVLSSRLPELERIINEYGVGTCTDSHDPRHIAQQIDRCLSDETLRATWKKNLPAAAEILCRENEEKELRNLYARFLRP